MTAERPLKRLHIAELEGLFAAESNDAATLAKLEGELVHRNARRAQVLLDSVRKAQPPRPLMQVRIEELEALFAAQGRDAATLMKLEGELVHRKLPRARALVGKVRSARRANVGVEAEPPTTVLAGVVGFLARLTARDR
jgi:hypothetical protein